MFPLLSKESFNSPMDKEGNALFYRVASYSEFRSIPSGATLYIAQDAEVDFPRLPAIAKENGFTLQKIGRVPLHIRNLICDKEKSKY